MLEAQVLESDALTPDEPQVEEPHSGVVEPSPIQATEPADDVIMLRRSTIYSDLERLEKDDPAFKRELHKFTSPRTRKQADAIRQQYDEEARAHKKLRDEHEALTNNHLRLQLTAYDNAVKGMTDVELAKRIRDDRQFAQVASEMERVRQRLNAPKSPDTNVRPDSDADRELYLDIDAAIEEAELSGMSEGRAEWLRKTAREDPRVLKLPPHRRLAWAAQEIKRGLDEDARPATPVTSAPAATPKVETPVANQNLARLAQTDTSQRSGSSRNGSITSAQWYAMSPMLWNNQLAKWGVRNVVEAREKGYIKG